MSDKKGNGSGSGKNVWDILELLINKGAVFTLVLLIFSAFILISAWRVPPDDLSNFWKFIGQVAKTHWGVSTALLLASNLSWWIVHKNTKKLLKSEISRLTRLRKKLMHGENVIIEEHKSSKDGNEKITILRPSGDEIED